MDTILYFFRDQIISVHYFIYAFVILILIFAIIGYLYKQKYAKVEIKLATSQANVSKAIENKSNIKLDRKNAKKLAKAQKKQAKLNNKKNLKNEHVETISLTTNPNNQGIKPSILDKNLVNSQQFVNESKTITPIIQQSKIEMMPQAPIQPVTKNLDINNQSKDSPVVNISKIQATTSVQQEPVFNQPIPEVKYNTNTNTNFQPVNSNPNNDTSVQTIPELNINRVK